MNKFFAFAIMALVCASARAEIEDEMSQFAITTTDSEEVANVPEDLKIAFEDFCIRSRDYVLNDVKQSTNSLTSNVFKIFFNSVEALGQESMENQKLATEKLSQQLANPSAPVDRSEGKLNELIADAQEKMKGQTTPLAMFTAIKTALSATSSSVGAYFSDKFDKVKELGSIEQVGNGLSEVCGKVRSYEEAIKGLLEEYKENSLNSEEKYAGLTLDNVKCATARRLSQIEGACRFAANLRPFAAKILGY